eukprot:TRINITY_DN38123_c0_g1_i1.p1 TRINITY_DN38123_c0_g1~~TRINITY_DN38123_c0_g1_i1.p1  ORF type:complete len:488 (+),score=110.97 TRINITY_DN38123_c0_g1_i1:74-1537(+)
MGQQVICSPLAPGHQTPADEVKIGAKDGEKIDALKDASTETHGDAKTAVVKDAIRPDAAPLPKNKSGAQLASEVIDSTKSIMESAMADTKMSMKEFRAGFGKLASDGLSAVKAGVHEAKAGVYEASADLKKQLTDQMDLALASSDNTAINDLLDSAMSNSLLGKAAPASLKRAAEQTAKRQLKDAISSEDPKRLKGALVAATRLNATELPEFEEAALKYKSVRKMPAGWDMSKMVMHRKGDKMVAKMELNDSAARAKFQALLDLTYRDVYTRDRKGGKVPDRLELVRVSAVTNDDLWADYMARREVIRQEIHADSADFERYEVDTSAGGSPSAGESAESISNSLALDFSEPLLPDVNEVFLFHGTHESAADAITTKNFRINLAGSHTGSLLGRGLYLAENSTKSDEYTVATGKGERHLLLCRVVLGRVHYTAEVKPDARACEEVCQKGRFHSVLGDRKLCRGTFREFVVFDEEQIYANYVLTYRRIL